MREKILNAKIFIVDFYIEYENQTILIIMRQLNNYIDSKLVLCGNRKL